MTLEMPEDQQSTDSPVGSSPDFSRIRPRSFVLRGGRLGPGQRRALETLGPSFLLPFSQVTQDWASVFNRQAPLVFEVGSGMGDATVTIAESNPDKDFVAVEVHEAGIGAILKLIGERGLTNIRVIRYDAVKVIEQMIAPGSLAGVHVFFPDPWPKKRHHKRRLIQPPFIKRLAICLAPTGYLHCATDWKPYAAQMLAVLSNECLLRNSSEFNGFVPRPDWRPITKFERRGFELGHGSWDLHFQTRLQSF